MGAQHVVALSLRICWHRDAAMPGAHRGAGDIPGGARAAQRDGESIRPLCSLTALAVHPLQGWAVPTDPFPSLFFAVFASLEAAPSLCGRIRTWIQNCSAGASHPK